MVDRDEMQIPTRRRALDRAFEYRNSFRKVPADGQPPAELSEQVGIVRIEIDRLTADAITFGVASREMIGRCAGL
jgi:hypothetical protein